MKVIMTITHVMPTGPHPATHIKQIKFALIFVKVLFSMHIYIKENVLRFIQLGEEKDPI